MASAAAPQPAATKPAERKSVLSGPLARRLIMFVMFTVACMSGAQAGAWYFPFAVGLIAGAIGSVERLRGLVPLTVAAAIAGWAIPLWFMALHGQPVGATARTIAALAGLPPYAAVAVAATLLLAALQVLAAAWLARSLLPRRWSR